MKIVYIFLLAFTISCKSSSPGKIKKTTEKSLIIVDYSIAESKAFSYPITGYGKLSSINESDLSFRTSGKLDKLWVENGTYISKGDTIASLNNDDILIDRIKITEALKIKRDVFNTEVLHYSNDVSSIEPFILNKLKIRTGYQQALQDSVSLSIKESKYFLISPYNGVVNDLFLKKGEHIKSTDKFCNIYDASILIADIFVLGSDALNLQKGDDALIKIIAKNSIEIKGYISSINPKVDENSLTRIEITLLTQQLLFSGLKVKATLFDTSDQTVVVPKSSIVIREGNSVIFTYKGGKTSWEDVITGLDNGNEVQVKEGINKGDTIIVSNHLQIGHNIEVQLGKNK